MTPWQVRIARKAASLWCAAAVGALVFSVRIATTVFEDMPADRALAGRIAGRAFTGAYAIALVAAVIAVLVVWLPHTARSRVDRWMAAALLLGAGVELFWIAPAIVRRGVGWPGSFASLHATGGAVHLLLAVVALILAWRLLNGTDDAAP